MGSQEGKVISKSSDRLFKMQRVQPKQEISNFEKNESIPRSIFINEKVNIMDKNTHYRTQIYKPNLSMPQK